MPTSPRFAAFRTAGKVGLHLGEMALHFFERLSRSRVPPLAWIFLIWAVLVFPAIGLRGFYFEERQVVAIARGVLEDRQWLIPHLYGLRFVERPVLMSWLIAGLGTVGGINQYVARLPAVLSLLAGGVLVFSLVRRYASDIAAVFAVTSFFASPIVLIKVIVAEPDVLLSVLLFAAFLVWWNGHAAGGGSVLRWVAVGSILALACLTKGPQPLAFFGLGVGVFLLLRRCWFDFAGLALAGAMAGVVTAAWYWVVYQPGDIAVWASHSRLSGPLSVQGAIVDRTIFIGNFLFEMLPPLILAIPFGLVMLRGAAESDDLDLALLLYAFCCSLVLLFWPDARVRHAMPSVLALAGAAGLAFDRFRLVRPRLANIACLIAAGLIAYQIVLSWVVMPLVPDLFQKSRIAGRMIAKIIETRPAMLYITVADTAVLYVPPPVRQASLEELLVVPAPAWALVSVAQAEQLLAMRPDFELVVRDIFQLGRSGRDTHLLELRTK